MLPSVPHVRASVLGLLISYAALAAETAGATAPRKPIPAFPGAEGFGATTPGGRRGRIIEVTNLNPSGPGSLKAACGAKGPRIVVFRVSGVIPCNPWISEPFITIAGQTAPGDGICIRGSLVIQAHDVIVRHLRIRPGDHPLIGRGPESRDCLEVSTKKAHNVIVDHCSCSWGIDENVSGYSYPHDVTFQWCITSEALDDSTHPKGPHGKGMLTGGGCAAFSIHHCLFAHNVGRNPLIASRRDTPNPVFDVRNNVIYNRDGATFSQILGHSRVNFVGNYQKHGASPNNRRPGTSAIHWFNPYDKPHGSARVYLEGNIWPGNPDGKLDPWQALEPVADGKVVRKCRGFAQLKAPAECPPITTETAAAAYENVLEYTGCTRPVRDVVDERVIAEVRAGTGRIVDSQNDVGGYPTYASVPPPADTDHDAMPDAWESRFGFSPKDASDGPEDLDGDGYTNVEEFLNETDPTQPDTGAPTAQRPPTVQKGNDRIRGKAARKIQEQRLAEALKPNATKESAQALLTKVKASGKEVADYLGIRFVNIPAGEFMLREIKVTLTRPYELSACEITQAQWEAVMSTRPWSGRPAAKDDRELPVTYVTYLDCQEFIRRLNACLPVRGTQAGGDREYRLPTCCEWLHAARGGTDSPFGFGFENKKEVICEYAWCQVLRGPVMRRPKSPQAVAQLKPNPYGLYDMAGNAREWVHDRVRYWRQDLEQSGATDFMGSETGVYHMACGGHFRYYQWEILHNTHAYHRPHYRSFGSGFRLQRAAPGD